MNIIKRPVYFAIFLLVIIAGSFFIGAYLHNNYMVNKEIPHQHFHEMLNLTPDQLEKLIPIEEKFAEQKAFYENQIRQANRELGDVMKKEKAYTPAVQDAVKKVHVAMGHLQEVTLIHFFDMRALLDDKQVQILDNYVADALHDL